ncbi:MAG: GTPase Era [Candidatus Kapabacteria bacterium]|nr:GTPase Era [Candidatus Kapabacteria bacterium]
MNKTNEVALAKTKAGYVAIIGKPNAGKSTLMNKIIGTKLSIVTPKPQTTRKRVLGIYSENNTQIVFLDTPGIINPRYEMQKTMMGYVVKSVEESDAVLVLIDLTKFEDFESYFSLELTDVLKKTKKPKILLINKIDTFKEIKEVLPLIKSISDLNLFDDIIPISALKGENVKSLIPTIEKYLPNSEFYYDPELLSTQPERFFVSEIIREQVFISYAKEIPYSTEIAVVEFKERENGKWYISAEIIIERGTQKRIIIGEKGAKLKEIGEKSRKAIEEHLDTPVYLELFVKVREKWRDNTGMLKSFGY